jgi:crotonobetaine/carnitine-CoA ligase
VSVTGTEHLRCDIGTLLERRATEFADRPFVTILETGETYTYSSFDREVNRVAHGMAAWGVEPGDFVCLMLPNVPEFLFASYALKKLGAVEVAINSAFRGTGLARMLNLTGSSLLITATEFLEPLRQIGGEAEHVRTVVLTDGDGGQGTPFPRAEMVAFGALRSDDDRPLGRATADLDLATIMFTSGTTGVSKGCMLSHRYGIRVAEGQAELLGMTPEDCVYCIFPLFHMTGAFNDVLASMVAGARFVLRRKFSASRFWDEVAANGVTILDFVGSAAKIVTTGPARRDHAVRAIAGGPLPDRDDFRERFGGIVMNSYGSTDTGVPTIERPDELGPPGSHGRARSELYEIQIADEHGDPVPCGERGELLIRSREPGVMTDGYFGMPEATMEAFRHQWFHTGDLAKVDADGWLYYLGRLRDSIRRRGENVSAFELEEAITTHPDVEDCAALGVPSELGEEEILVVVIPRPDTALDAEEIRAHCRERVARFMVPDHVEFVEEMPRTPTGKPAKTELVKLFGPKQTINR